VELPADASRTATDTVAVPPDLEATWTAQVQSLNQSDGELAGSFFSEEAFVMVGPKRFQGREDLIQRWLSVYLKVVEDVQVQPSSFLHLGVAIVEQGVYSYHAGETRRGVYSQTWVKDADGKWKIRSMLGSGISGY
jgi:ketosteroid isomerase-like protein